MLERDSFMRHIAFSHNHSLQVLPHAFLLLKDLLNYVMKAVILVPCYVFNG